MFSWNPLFKKCQTLFTLRWNVNWIIHAKASWCLNVICLYDSSVIYRNWTEKLSGEQIKHHLHVRFAGHCNLCYRKLQVESLLLLLLAFTITQALDIGCSYSYISCWVTRNFLETRNIHQSVHRIGVLSTFSHWSASFHTDSLQKQALFPLIKIYCCHVSPLD